MTKPATIRRNISGVLILTSLPHDGGKRYPTCIEDCSESTRLQWLHDLELDTLKDIANHLTNRFDRLWDILSEKEQDAILNTCGGKPYCEVTFHKYAQIHHINQFCKLLRHVADCAGIAADGSEAAGKGNIK